MRLKKNFLLGLIQRIYITWDTYVANDLFTYASSGAYSFLLSALPVVLMVLVILLRIVNASPDYIRSLLESTTVFTGSLDLSRFFDSVMSIKRIGIFELIIGFSIFWMARRFFISIQQGITIIYRKRGKGKPLKENLIVIAGEAILIFLIVIMILIISAGNAFLNTALSTHLLPPIILTVLINLFRFAPLAIIFFFLFLIYLLTPRTRPSATSCLSAAFACTVSLAVVQFAFRSFMNLSRYNLVYGILSNLIVLLLEVYLFFVLLLFFAQYIYVNQFFDSYILAQLYLLPGYEEKGFFNQLKRIMFLHPPRFYRRFALTQKAGSRIFEIGEESSDLFYIWRGAVSIKMPNQVLELGQGKVFGEFASLIGGTRTATATALTDTVLLKIPSLIFLETIEVNGEISRRTLRMIADYVRKKNNAEPLLFEDET